MKIKSQRDFVSGLMFIAIGVAFAVGATNYNFGVSARPGPGYFPFILGVLMAILGAMVLFSSLVIETEDGEPIGAIAWKPLILILGAIIIFGAALPRLGMVITVPLLIIIAGLGGDEFHWVGAIVTSIVLTIGSYLAFVYGLGLTIPVWPSFVS